ncbi:hypothetical protein AGMMS49936_08180 [Endomicrobiia bacterium]|nr:hypothetical protein AGMMS49936_08180 [Endomicrobiia bacterium]
MKRHTMTKLVSWKNKVNKMPLIVEGARQVGKTWLIQEFGKTQYDNTVYINFDINIKSREIFQKDIDPHTIINKLELLSASKIDPHNNLIIFDEIQECTRALGCLKYFCEQAPEYNIIAAGSILGVATHANSSFPVGKVETLSLYPLNFSEFLEAIGETRYQQALTNKDYNIFTVIEDDLISKLKLYYFIGGMPKAVLSYIQQRNMQEVRSIQENIIANYEKDFSKHINRLLFQKLQ